MLKATVVHIRVTLGNYRLFFSISKHKANITELHPKVRQTCLPFLLPMSQDFAHCVTRFCLLPWLETWRHMWLGLLQSRQSYPWDAKVRSPLYYSGLLLAGPAGARMSERLIYLFIKICFRYSYFYFISKDS